MDNIVPFNTGPTKADLVHFICPVCSQLFNDPRALSCGDTYCWACLQAELAKGPVVVCKKCNKELVNAANAPRLYDVANFLEKVLAANVD